MQQKDTQYKPGGVGSHFGAHPVTSHTGSSPLGPPAFFTVTLARVSKRFAAPLPLPPFLRRPLPLAPISCVLGSSSSRTLPFSSLTST